jgi:hypothetical protein
MREVGFPVAAFSRGVDFLLPPAGLRPGGLLDFGGFFDKCLVEK